MAEASSILPLLASLPLSHPSFSALVDAHRPFAHPSQLPQGQLTKLLNRLNSLVLSRNEDDERRTALELAQLIVQQDEEGWAMTNFGKGWVGTCLGAVASSSTPLASVSPSLALLKTLVLSSSQFPAFERENIHPIMGKLSVSLGRLLERALADEQREWAVVLLIVESIRALLIHSPANFRPLVPTLKPQLYTLILQIPTAPSYTSTIPDEIRHAAATLLSALHVTAGKAHSSAAWGAEMRDVLGGLGRSIVSITSDAWEEDPVRVAPPASPSALPELPADPLARLPIALDWLEGHVEALLALLRFSTSRPVPVPIAQIVSAGLRCLNLTLDTPTVAYISPQHHGALLAALPRIWTAGLQLISAIALACGDHLFPHVNSILDHTVWLIERLPASMTESQSQLLRFHQLIFTLYPPALIPVEYPSRLLRFCLTRLSPLLDSRTRHNGSEAASNGGGGGKRGKKRARGAEDSLVGGLEGREGRAIGENESGVILEALKLVPTLHSTPLLAPGLLTFSIRLHLSLHLSLQSLPSSAFSSSASLNKLKDASSNVLEEAALMTEGENGTARGWKNLIYAVLTQRSQNLAPILHPSLPPLMRPLPPLSALHFFAPEAEDEKRERREMGFGVVTDLGATNGTENEDDSQEMDVDALTGGLSLVGQPQAVPSTAAKAASAFASVSSSISASTATSGLPQTTLPVFGAASQLPSTIVMPLVPASTASTVNAAQAPITSAESSVPGSTSATTVASEFISVPTAGSSGRTSSSSVVATTVVVDDGEDSDGPLPDLDSGSDDDMLDDDDEEE